MFPPPSIGHVTRSTGTPQLPPFIPVQSREDSDPKLKKARRLLAATLDSATEIFVKLA